MSEEQQQAYKDALFINAGSVWDIEVHLKNYPTRYSIAELTAEVERERITRNRKTVINKINSLIRRLEKAGSKP